jgi:hypothetical protein
VTTSSQQTVLSGAELACLRDVAEGRPRAANETDIDALVAKGMLAADDASGHTLTPAGHHALNVGEPGMVPGIDE